MSENFFSEIFRMFVEYENDLTVYCFEDELEQFKCDIPNKKELSEADKQLLKRVREVLGKNYRSKLAQLFSSAVKYAETGVGTIKIKKPDGTADVVPIARLIGGDPEKVAKSLSGKKKSNTMSSIISAASVAAKLGKQALDASQGLSGDGSNPLGAIGTVLGSSGIMKKIENLLSKIDTLSTLDANKVKTMLNQTVVTEVIAKVNKPVVDELQELNKQMKLMIDEIKKLQK